MQVGEESMKDGLSGEMACRQSKWIVTSLMESGHPHFFGTLPHFKVSLWEI